MLIHNLKNTATASDMNSDNYMVIDGLAGSKKVPGDMLALKSAGTDEIHNLTQTATETDLKSGNYFALDGADGTKRLPAETIKKIINLQNTTNGAVIVAASTAGIVADSKMQIIDGTTFVEHWTGTGRLKDITTDLDMSVEKYVLTLNIENISASGTGNVRVYARNGNTYTTQAIITNASGPYVVEVRPQVFADKGWTALRLTFATYDSQVEQSWRVTDFVVKNVENSEIFDNISGENAKELFRSVDEKILYSKLSKCENGSGQNVAGVFDLKAKDALKVIDNSSFTIENKSVGSWTSLKNNLPIDGSLYHIAFKTENQTIATYPNSVCTIYVADGIDSATAGRYDRVADVKDGTFDFIVDPNYYVVHKGWTAFTIWVRYDDGNGSTTKIWKFTDFRIYKKVDEMVGSVITGNTAKELFESTDRTLADLKSSVEQFAVEVKGSNQNRYEIGVNNSGNIVAIPIVPTKAHFFGNSLLTSNGATYGDRGVYGMNATAPEYDYASRFAQCVLTLNSSYTYTRDRNSPFEDQTTSDPSVIDPIISANYLDKLDGDEDFICVQIGDNSSAQAINVLGANVERLLIAIRNKCNKARVFVFGMWYSTTSKQIALNNAATKTGCKFINMDGIRSALTESHIGEVTYVGSVAAYTLDDVVSVTENTATNITINFTIGGVQYSATIDVVEYNMNTATQIWFRSNYKITTNGGVASHPSNEGFRQLANRLLYESKIVDTDEYFPAT